MMEPVDFYVFRHGETDLNKQKRWQGSGMDYDLNQTGIRQAAALVDKLQGKGLEIIFSSPLKRALHTAEVVGDALDIQVEIENDLRECYYGDAEGMLISELQQSVPEVVNNWNKPQFMEIAFPNGERKDVALRRVLGVLERLAQGQYRKMGIAIHGGTMAAMLNYLQSDFDKIPNCACIHVVYDGSFHLEGGIF